MHADTRRPHRRRAKPLSSPQLPRLERQRLQRAGRPSPLSLRKIWNLQTGARVKVLRGHCDVVSAVAVLDERHLVSADLSSLLVVTPALSSLLSGVGTPRGSRTCRQAGLRAHSSLGRRVRHFAPQRTALLRLTRRLRRGNPRGRLPSSNGHHSGSFSRSRRRSVASSADRNFWKPRGKRPPSVDWKVSPRENDQQTKWGNWRWRISD